MFSITPIVRKKDRTLRMPARFADMTEEGMEYGGSGCWPAFCCFFGTFLFAGGLVCWSLNTFLDIGDKKTMTIAAVALGVAGAAFIAGGIIACCRSGNVRQIHNHQIYGNLMETPGGSTRWNCSARQEPPFTTRSKLFGIRDNGLPGPRDLRDPVGNTMRSVPEA